MSQDAILTTGQVAQIVSNINAVLESARSGLQVLDTLTDPDYAKGRKMHNITSLVYSAFTPNNNEIDGLTIRKQYYGAKSTLCMPELRTETGDSIFVYNVKAKPYGTNVIIDAVEKLGPELYLLEFEVTNYTYTLERLFLVSFDGLTAEGLARIKEKVRVF